MTESIGETREELIGALDLSKLFCENVSRDFQLRWKKDHPVPPVVSAGVTFGAAIFCSIIGSSSIALIFYLFSGLQFVWMAWVVIAGAAAHTAEKQEMIRHGQFPPESLPLVMARLHLWNHLMAPKQWSRHSRIHDRKYKLEQQIQHLMKRLSRLQDEEAGAHEEIAELPPEEIAGIAVKISTLAERRARELLIAQIQDERQRLLERKNLYEALLLKIKQVTDMLDQVDKLGLVLRDVSGHDLTRVVSEAMYMLEERRQLIDRIDNIDPDTFLELVAV